MKVSNYHLLFHICMYIDVEQSSKQVVSKYVSQNVLVGYSSTSQILQDTTKQTDLNISQN